MLSGLAAKVILSGLAAKTILSGVAANVILSGMAAKTILIGLVAMKSLSGSAAKTTIWLSGLAADASLSGTAAKTKTLLSGLAAVRHGSQDQHGPNFLFFTTHGCRGSVRATRDGVVPTISSSCLRHGAQGARQFPLLVVYHILNIFHIFSTISHHL